MRFRLTEPPRQSWKPIGLGQAGMACCSTWSRTPPWRILMETTDARNIPLETAPEWLDLGADFGRDDQLGRINLLTADKVRAGAAEVRTGPRVSACPCRSTYPAKPSSIRAGIHRNCGRPK